MAVSKKSYKPDWLDFLSNFMAHNKGLPVFISIGLIVVGLVLHFFPTLSEIWLVRSDFFLYVGTIVGFVGLLIGDAV